jgi:beta-galactosidase/beta-glucuronidase
MPNKIGSSHVNGEHGYPRPQLVRKEWFCLDGEWDFALDLQGSCETPGDVTWGGKIKVPFSPESPASGIGDTRLFRGCWYRREFEPPELAEGECLLLHFAAVDYKARVWVNGEFCVEHEGGYTPFLVDITDFRKATGPQVIVVGVNDDGSDLAKPRGKQDWKPEPHSIWYPRTTGIWQSVWMERVASSYLKSIRWVANIERWEITMEARIEGSPADDLRLSVKLSCAGRLLADDTYSVIANEVHRRIALSDPGLDDFRNELLWTPETPTLIEAQISLWRRRGELLDEVLSYTALRSIGVDGDKFVLNNRPYQLRMVLDQGYWPEGGLTAPNDQGYRRDVELVKAMGFNGVRKHQKIESPRYLYWADVLGLVVWEEMPSAYRFTKASIARLAQEWIQAMARDDSHPCIVTWVTFNESWGVPDLPNSPAQRHYVQALYHLTKTLDPTRPVVGNDGWESVATDIIGIHDYDDQPTRIAKRYGSSEFTQLIKRERPAGRILSLMGQAAEQPIMITEFGGIAYSRDAARTWGYSRSSSEDDFRRRFTQLLRTIRSLPGIAGFCYTQFCDTYQEANGLLYADRTPKIPIEAIALATQGQVAERDVQQEWEFRERLMHEQRQQYSIPPDDHKTSNDPR